MEHFTNRFENDPKVSRAYKELKKLNAWCQHAHLLHSDGLNQAIIQASQRALGNYVNNAKQLTGYSDLFICPSCDLTIQATANTVGIKGATEILSIIIHSDPRKN